MDYIKRFENQAEGIGYIAKTPFSARVKGVREKILFIPETAGEEVEIIDDGTGFITYEEPTGGTLEAIYFGNGSFTQNSAIAQVQLPSWDDFIELCDKYGITHANGYSLDDIKLTKNYGLELECDEKSTFSSIKIVEAEGAYSYHNFRAWTSQFTSEDGSICLADIELTPAEYSTWKLPAGVEMDPIPQPA